MFKIKHTTREAIELAFEELRKTYPGLSNMVVRPIRYSDGLFGVRIWARDHDAAGVGRCFGFSGRLGWDATRIFLSELYAITPDALVSCNISAFEMKEWTKSQFNTLYPSTAFLDHWDGDDVWMHDIRDIKHIVQRPVDPDTAWNITATDSDGESWIVTVRDHDLEKFFANEIYDQWDPEDDDPDPEAMAAKVVESINTRQLSGYDTTIEVWAMGKSYNAQRMRVFQVD